MAHLRLIRGGADKEELPEGDRQLVGIFDLEDPDGGWYITSRNIETIWNWAENVPSMILFHFNIDQEI